MEDNLKKKKKKEDNLKKNRDDLKKMYVDLKKTKSTKINLIGCDTIVN